MPPTATLAPSTPTLTYKEFQGRVLERKAVDPDAQEDYIREALVAVTGNTDDGGDVIQPGAFNFKRTPKIVWSHDLKALVAKVLAYEEWLPGDARIAEVAPDLADKGLGALWFRIEFDPLDPESYKAFRKVDFHEDLGWSIGYETPPDGFKILKDGRRLLTKIVVWEGSPTTFGMNMEARTVALKSLIASSVETLGLSEEKAKAVQDLIATIASPGPEEEKTWPPLAGSFEETQEALRDAVRAWAVEVYGDVSPENDWWCSLEGTFEAEVIASVRVYNGDQENGTWRFPYVAGEDGTVELGEAVPVEIETTVQVADATTTTPVAAETAAADLEGLDAKAFEEAMEEVKKGRVLSAANAAALAAAAEAIGKVLAAAAPKDDDEDDPPKEKVLSRAIVGKGKGGVVQVPAPEVVVPEGKEALTDAEWVEMMALAET